MKIRKTLILEAKDKQMLEAIHRGDHRIRILIDLFIKLKKHDKRTLFRVAKALFCKP